MSIIEKIHVVARRTVNKLNIRLAELQVIRGPGIWRGTLIVRYRLVSRSGLRVLPFDNALLIQNGVGWWKRQSTPGVFSQVVGDG